MNDSVLPKFDPKAGGLRGAIGLVIEFLTVFVIWIIELARAAMRHFRAMSPRARGVTLILTALLILLLCGILLANLVKANIEAANQPSIKELLGTAPFNLDTRPLPAIGDDMRVALPAAFGTFKLGAELVPIYAPTSLVNQCLLQFETEAAENCNVTFARLNRGFGRYASGQDVVDIGVARLADDVMAEETFAGLYRYGRRIGRTGNFSIRRVGPADYFYSKEPGWITFAYSRGAWVFAVSARNESVLNAAVEAFPH